MKIGRFYFTPSIQQTEKNMDLNPPASGCPEDGDISSSRECSSAQDDGNSSLTPTTTKYPESWLPPPRPFSTDLVGLSIRKGHPPAIAIPSISGHVTASSARSPSASSIQIPTPSAPSPIPLALRPRLVIPSSPPISPHLFSPQSLNSAHSVQSNISEVSISSSYSNPRPPEDSTPYPQTATPLSGYPRDSESRWKIYSEEVTVLMGSKPSSPAFSLDENSPAASPHFFEDPTDTPVQAALSESWFQGTPVGRRPEPFPWGDITGNLPSEYDRATPESEEPFNGSETPQDSLKVDFQTPISIRGEEGYSA